MVTIIFVKFLHRCSSDSNNENFIYREKAQLWCIKHGFELVEMNPDVEDFDECKLICDVSTNTWLNY